MKLKKAWPRILVGAGLGENLDATVAEAVVLGGEGVAVDAYLADGFLRRQAPAREAVEVDLRLAVHARGGAGQSLQRFGETFGVVRQSVEVGAAQDDRARARLGVGAHVRLGGDGDDLFLDGDGEHHVERLRATGGDFDLKVLVEREARRRDAHRVATGRERGEDVAALFVGRRRALDARGVRRGDGRADHHAAERVGHLPAQSRLRLLREGRGRADEDKQQSQR